MGNPISRNNKKTGIITSGMVLWDGPDIPCLDLCKGDTINQVYYKIAQKVCALVDDYKDLATLDYSCILNLCNVTNCADLADPDKVSIKNIFQLLLDNDCALKTLIDEVQTKINNISNGGLTLDLELKCVEDYLFNICSDPENYSLNDLLQALINLACDVNEQISTLGSQTNTLNESVTEMSNKLTAVEYTEPTLTDECSVDPINSGSALIANEFAVQLANKICFLNEIIGSESDLADVLAEADTTNINTNLAQNETNQWLYMMELQSRLSELESNCCQVNCSRITIGFYGRYIAEDRIYRLNFSYGTGTDIYPGFTDCGSVITLRDQSGAVVSSKQTITNNCVINISADTLDTTENITVEIETCFSNGSFTCNNFYVQTIPGTP